MDTEATQGWVTFANAPPERDGRLRRVHRFLACSRHTGRQPPDCFIIEADSAHAIEERYPLFEGQIYRLPDERPEWLTDMHLAFIESGSAHKLGDAESPMLKVLLDHLANGDTWRWYALEQRPKDGDPVSRGELGTFRELDQGGPIGGLPRISGRWDVVAVEPAPHSAVAAKLIISPTRAARRSGDIPAHWGRSP